MSHERWAFVNNTIREKLMSILFISFLLLITTPNSYLDRKRKILSNSKLAKRLWYCRQCLSVCLHFIQGENIWPYIAIYQSRRLNSFRYCGRQQPEQRKRLLALYWNFTGALLWTWNAVADSSESLYWGRRSSMLTSSGFRWRRKNAHRLQKQT